MIPEFNLEGKVALVTGGSRSLGRATAKVLAEAGADVAICGRWEEGLQRVATEIKELGRRSLSVVCDVSDPEQVDGLFSSCLETLGRLDICIANAGMFQVPPTPSDQVSLETWDQVMDTNLRGAMLTCNAAGRAMIERGGGSIVVISSIQGVRTIPGTLSYVASKHAVIGMARTMAVDWAKQNVRVNVIAPGFIERDGNPLAEYPELMELVATRTPLGRQGQGRELALAVLFLASPAASYVTGATLLVDGGWTAI